jgi:hypothetical protein
MSANPSDDPTQRRIADALRLARRAQEPHGERPHLAGDLLLAYWQNTLGMACRDAINDHVAGCAVCRAWLNEVGRLFS